jgi:hypothetical protein
MVNKIFASVFAFIIGYQVGNFINNKATASVAAKKAPHARTIAASKS